MMGVNDNDLQTMMMCNRKQMNSVSQQHIMNATCQSWRLMLMSTTTSVHRLLGPIVIVSLHDCVCSREQYRLTAYII